jgi:hypothetical protein
MVVNISGAKSVIFWACWSFRMDDMLNTKSAEEILKWGKQIVHSRPDVFKGSDAEKDMASVELLKVVIGKPSKFDPLLS